MQVITTPKGEELVLLPRAEYERMAAAAEAAKHAREAADFAAGRLETFSTDDARAMLAAKTPLAFWRKKRGLTQVALARQVAISQSFLAEIEAGKKLGDVTLYRRLAQRLDVTMEQLVPEPPLTPPASPLCASTPSRSR